MKMPGKARRGGAEEIGMRVKRAYERGRGRPKPSRDSGNCLVPLAAERYLYANMRGVVA